MKKRILSMLCSIAILCTLFTGVANAQEIDSDKKIVDGSYLTQEDSSTGTSVPKGARGEYLATGDCTISKAGLTRIYAYASTTANQVVNYMATIVYVEQYDEEADAWGQVYSWVEEDHDDYIYMEHQIDSRLYERQGKAITNFQVKLPKAHSDLADQTLKDPYNFDFLSLSESYDEKDLEEALINQITQFLLELGTGFSYLGNRFILKSAEQIFIWIYYFIMSGCTVTWW